MFIGDNLKVMQQMNSGHIDLIYLDPPFNSNHNYAAPIGSEAAGAEFKDTWTLQDVDEVWHGYLADKHPALYSLIQATGEVSGDSMKSYLIYMAMRILEMKRLLKPTGSIYLHCDPTAGHYLKLAMDAVFGRQNFRNEIVWCYRGMTPKSRKFNSKHDCIYFYTKTNKYLFNELKGEPTPESINTYRSAMNRGYNANHARNMVVIFDEAKYRLAIEKKIIPSGMRESYFDGGNPRLTDWWTDIKILGGPKNKERVGYPTQKPQKLLERIIKASSNEGDIVFDPFCGCSTTLIAAQDLKRKWVGIDISPKAGELIKFRIESQLFLYYEGKVTDKLPKRSPEDKTDDELFPDIKRLPYNHPTIKQLLFGQQEEHCKGCYEVFRFKTFEVDHIDPRSKGGKDDISNLQLLCPNCNRRKGNRSMEEFAAMMLQEKEEEMERRKEEFERMKRHHKGRNV